MLIGLLGSSLISNDANLLPRLGWFGMARGMFKEATAFNIGAWNAASANTLNRNWANYGRVST